MAKEIDVRSLFEEKKVHYERLTHLVTLILRSRIKKEKMKVHSMKQRVKRYDSFIEKIHRKNYKKPFKDCTDLAGCRVICLFLSQIDQLKKLIEEEFEVIESSDKKSAKKFDQFGYLSLHLLVKIPKKRLQFVEYKDLSNLVCEIQIRTILQEAWAEIEHYLNYKTTKQEKNEELLRKMFSLSGMFEVADNTFEEIHNGFSTMVKKKLKKKVKKEETDEVTALSLYTFVADHFKDPADWDKTLERRYYRLSKELLKLGIKKISVFELIVNKQERNIKKFLVRRPETTPIELLRVALACEFKEKYDLAYGLRGFSAKVRQMLL